MHIHDPQNSFYHDVFIEELESGRSLTNNDLQFIALQMTLQIVKHQLNDTFTEEKADEAFATYQSYVPESSVPIIIATVGSMLESLDNLANIPMYTEIQAKLRATLNMKEKTILGYFLYLFSCTQSNPDVEEILNEMCGDLNAIDQMTIFQTASQTNEWVFNS